MSLLQGKHLAGDELADLSRGRLGKAKAARARAHLGDCERCLQSEQRVLAGLEVMAELPKQEAPDLAWDHIGARVYWGTSSERRARERTSSTSGRRVRLGFFGLGAAAVVGSAVFWGLGTRVESSGAEIAVQSAPGPALDEGSAVAVPTSKPDAVVGAVVFAQGVVRARGQAAEQEFDLQVPVVAGAEFTTGTGRLVIQFGSSSAFRIAPNSTLSIDRFDSERIALRIVGQVDVDITRRLPGQEFAVVAGHHEVQVRGTAFRVDYSGGELGVLCIRGKVVVSDGDHGVHVPAGQRFEILQGLQDATLRALPIDAAALDALGRAMKMPMLAQWQPEGGIVASTAILEIESAADLGIAVDGDYIADGAFRLRASTGDHEVALVDRDGGIARGRVLHAGAGKRTQARLVLPSKPSLAGRALRKRQLTVAVANSPRTDRCLARLSKQGLLSGAYLSLEVGINKDGTQSYLNLLDSNLSPAIQACLRDVVDAQHLPKGSAASFRLRLSY
ncbi:MAG: FecR domain-containing protein [Myxococcales bacterium]|nr:FecR domain-containing protein [Myxococcales bacterium]